MEDTNQFKYTIDKKKLQEFCTGMPIDGSHLKALDMLITVILLKWSKYSFYFKDFRQYFLLRAFSIRNAQKFDSKQSAYNYLFTTFTNFIKNWIDKYSKEPNFETMLSAAISAEASRGTSDFSDVVVSSHEILSQNNDFDTFKEVAEYFPYLTGEVHFVKKRIPSKDVLNLLLFLRLHEKKLLAHVVLPGFIYDDMDSDATRALYKLSSDLISLFDDEYGEDDLSGSECTCSED